MDHSAYAAVAAQQNGVIGRDQLGDRTSRRQIERLVATGRIVAIRRGVYRIAGSPETWEQQLHAACLAAGPTARASLRSAAALWMFDGFARDVLEVTVEPARRARLPGVVVHESNVDLPTHRATRSRIPVTSVARTLVDLSSLLPPSRVGRLVDDAIRRRLTTIAHYEQCARELAGRGRRRSTITRSVIDARRPSQDHCESDAEVHIAELLASSGLPRPVTQHRVRVANRTVRIDLAYPRQMVAIEYDGWKHHQSRSAFDLDRERANQLEVLGWTVLRFTSESTDSAIVTTVRAVLERRSVG